MSENSFCVIRNNQPGTLRYSLMSGAERLQVDAHQYRLWQAWEMLRQAGFIELADGTWIPGEDSLT